MRWLLVLLPIVAHAAPRTEKWANGAAAEQTSFPDGDTTRWYQDGTVALRAHYKGGLLDGSFDLFDVYGKPLVTGTYAAGREEGEWFDRGLRGKYVHGLRVGTWKFADGSDVPEPDAKTCNGTVENYMFETRCMSHGVAHGPTTIYSPTDIHPLATEENHAGARPRLQGTMRLGRRHGTWTAFWPNGRKRWQGAYVDGYPTGEWKMWTDTGKQIGSATLDPAAWPVTLDKDFYQRGDAGCPAPAKLAGTSGVSLGCELPGGIAYGPKMRWLGGKVQVELVDMIDQHHGPVLVDNVPLRGTYAFGLRQGAFRHEGPDGEDAFYLEGHPMQRLVRFEGGQMILEQSLSHALPQFDTTFFAGGKVTKVEHYIRGYLAPTTNPPPTKPAPGSQWWKKSAPCPSGTTLVGGFAPSGEVACEKPGGIRHGPYTKFWYDGGVADEGAFVDGERDGPWHLFYVSGAPLEDSNWKSGLRVGHFVEHGPDGAILREGDFVDGVPNGKWKLAEESGTYDRGIRTADWKHGNDGDLPITPLEVNWNKQPNPCPPNINFFDGMHLQCSSGEYLHGPWSTRDERRHVLDRGRYRFGFRNGFWHYMYTNGKLAAEGMYRDGYRDGEWTFRARDGSSVKKFTLDAHVVMTSDCPLGTKRSGSEKTRRISCRYPDNVEHGPITIFDADRHVGVMRDGMREGWWTTTQSNGKSFRQWYFHDELDGSQTIDGVDERMRLGKRLGRRTTRAAGHVRDEGVMQNDRPIGRWTRYDAKGQIELVSNEDGTAIPYENGKPITK